METEKKKRYSPIWGKMPKWDELPEWDKVPKLDTSDLPKWEGLEPPEWDNVPQQWDESNTEGNTLPKDLTDIWK